jgi:pyruvate dehydrogenase E2 component (dihydrolipoamide acetyltransferase)
MADVVNMPKLGFDMAEGVLVRWVIAEGESVDKGAVLAEIETDKATVEVESSQSGVILKHVVEEGTPVPVGDPIAVIGDEGEDIDLEDLVGEEGVSKSEEKVALEEEEEKTQEEVEEVPDGAQLPGGVRASPLARRIAEEKGIDLNKVDGSGPRGRIVKTDIQAYEEKRVDVKEREPEPIPELVGEPREDRFVPLSGLRSRIGKRMQASMQTIPHFYVTYDYDMGALMDLRKQVNRTLEEEGVKLSVNDFIVKAVALTLTEYPNLNASLDEENNQIVHHSQINVGIAVALDDGLITVVNRDTDRKPLRMISSDLKEKVKRARDGKVRSEDIEGSTLSVSNLGMFGVEHFTAIINPPEAAIVAVGAVREVPIFKTGDVERALRMKATISIDHRISDGAEAAQFMQSLAKYIEEPLRLLI